MNDKTCWECEKTKIETHEHHPVPKSRGGTRTIPLCLECHAKAHHRKKNMSTSALVKEAIQRAKAEGKEFGNKSLFTEHGAKAIEVRKANAMAYKKRIRQLIADLIKDGYTTIDTQFQRLNELGIKTRTNKPFTYHNLYRVLKR